MAFLYGYALCTVVAGFILSMAALKESDFPLLILVTFYLGTSSWILFLLWAYSKTHGGN